MVSVIQRSDIPFERISRYRFGKFSILFEDGSVNSGISRLLYPVAPSRFESSTSRVNFWSFTLH